MNRPLARAPILFAFLAPLTLSCGGDHPTAATDTLPSVSADSAPLKLAFVAPNGLHVVNLDGHADSMIVKGMIGWHAWSTSAQRVAYVLPPTVFIHDRRAHTTIGVGSMADGQRIQIMEWSPDGSQLLFVTGGVIHVVNADGTQKRTSAMLNPVDVHWMPNGRDIAYASSGLWTIPASSPSAGAHRIGPVGTTFSVSPDGKTFATVSSQGQIVTLTTDDSTRQIIASPPCLPQCASDEDYSHPRWASDGQSLAAMVGFGMFVVNKDGSGFKVIVPSAITAEAVPEMDPEGLEIVYNSLGTIYLILENGAGPLSLGPISGASADLVRWAR